MTDTTPLTQEQTQELTAFVEELNEKLRSAASSSAERAFGLGCSIGLIPVVIVAVVLYSMRIINLILAVLVGIMSVMSWQVLLRCCLLWRVPTRSSAPTSARSSRRSTASRASMGCRAGSLIRLHPSRSR